MKTSPFKISPHYIIRFPAVFFLHMPPIPSESREIPGRSTCFVINYIKHAKKVNNTIDPGIKSGGSQLKQLLFCIRTGDIMERFNKFIDMVMEFLIVSVMFLVLLPFRILYNLSNRSASR
jgi:hypothetical protein